MYHVYKCGKIDYKEKAIKNGPRILPFYVVNFTDLTCAILMRMLNFMTSCLVALAIVIRFSSILVAKIDQIVLIAAQKNARHQIVPFSRYLRH